MSKPYETKSLAIAAYLNHVEGKPLRMKRKPNGSGYFEFDDYDTCQELVQKKLQMGMVITDLWAYLERYGEIQREVEKANREYRQSVTI